VPSLAHHTYSSADHSLSTRTKISFPPPPPKRRRKENKGKKINKIK
jgi:hypothetical protein